MRNKSQLLVSLVIGLSSLQGCSTIDSKTTGETQSADKATVATSQPSQAAQQATAAPSVEKAPVSADKPASQLDRYTVVAGDTLSSIAEKKEVYGDARLWPLLQRANINQVGPQSLLSIGQVLNINRTFSTEERTALIGKARTAKPATSAAPSASGPTAPSTTASAAAAAPVAQATAAVVTPAITPAAAPAVQSAAPAVAATSTSAAAVTNAPAAPAGAAAVPAQAAKPAEILSAGRRAFAAGDFPWTLYYYNSYLSTQKRDANAWGELGNVHFAMGNMADSAQAYFNAANLLIDQGKTAQAIQLVPAIEAGNLGLAEALHTRLTTVRR